MLYVNHISIKLEEKKEFKVQVCGIKGIHSNLSMQWKLFPELPLFLLLLAQGCPRVPAPVSVQAAFLLSLLLGSAFLFIPLIDDFLKKKKSHILKEAYLPLLRHLQ